MPETRIQTTFRVDADLLKKFRLALVERDTKMTPVIERLIRDWLHGYKFKEDERKTLPTLGSDVELAKADALRGTIEDALTKAANIGVANSVRQRIPDRTSTESTRRDATATPHEKSSPDPWQHVLAELQRRVNHHSFDTWLKPTRFSHSKDGILYVEVPTAEFRHVAEKYSELIQDALATWQTKYDEIQFVTPDNPLGDPAVSSYLEKLDRSTQLNPKYTFEDFVIGSGNQFAHAACQAVALRPSRAYNPLFVYGGVGIGKTHLVQAVGNEIKRRQPSAVICYITSERFTNEMVNALRHDRMAYFRAKFRSVDVLLIDDVQFLAEKERTQEELFHTFNALHESMKQVVIASDRSAKELVVIDDRLRSRFEWGLIADIQPPDFETKVAILQKKAEVEGVTLASDVASFVAGTVRSNVRELEGALVRLVAHSALVGAEITLPYAQQVLKNFVESQNLRISIESIQRAVAEQFGLRLAEIKSKNNSRAIAYPRQIAMYLARNLTDQSLAEIGLQFGGKHPTTVVRSFEKVDDTRKIDKDLTRLLDRLTEQLTA